MKLWVFRNEPGTGYYFCTKQPSPIYKDDMRGVVYTEYGELLGCIPTLTFEQLFPMLKFEGGSYHKVEIAELTVDGFATYAVIEGHDRDESSRPTKTK